MGVRAWIKDHWPLEGSALRVHRSRTFCERCGANADPSEPRHLSIPGAPDETGCGRRFAHVYVEFDMPPQRIACLGDQHPGVPVTLIRKVPDEDSPSGNVWQDYKP